MKQILKDNPELEEKRKHNAKEGAQKYAKAHKKELKERGYQTYLSHKEQQDAQLSELHKKQSKPVRCINNDQVYPSVSEASRQTSISQGNISACCRGIRKSAGKHPITKEKLKWEFMEEH